MTKNSEKQGKVGITSLNSHLLELDVALEKVANRSQSASMEVSSLTFQGKWQTNPTYDRFELMPSDDVEEKRPVLEGFLAIILLPPL